MNEANRWLLAIWLQICGLLVGLVSVIHAFRRDRVKLLVEAFSDVPIRDLRKKEQFSVALANVGRRAIHVKDLEGLRRDSGSPVVIQPFVYGTLPVKLDEGEKTRVLCVKPQMPLKAFCAVDSAGRKWWAKKGDVKHFNSSLESDYG